MHRILQDYTDAVRLQSSGQQLLLQVCVPTSCSLLASGAASPKPEASPEAASPKPETSPEPDASPQSTPHVAAAPTAGDQPNLNRRFKAFFGHTC